MKFTREDAQALNESIRHMNSPNLEEGLLSDVAIHAKDTVSGFAKKVASRVGDTASRARNSVKNLVAKGKDKVASAADSVGVLGQKIKRKLADNSEFVHTAVAKGAIRRIDTPEKDIIGGPKTANARKRVENRILRQYLASKQPATAPKTATAPTEKVKKSVKKVIAKANKEPSAPTPEKKTPTSEKKTLTPEKKKTPKTKTAPDTKDDFVLPPHKFFDTTSPTAEATPTPTAERKKAKKKILTVESLIRKYYK